MSDSIVLENSINSDINPADFSSKQWFYVNDNNNGNYNGPIVFDTTSLSNNQLYNNYSEGYLVLPLVMSLNGTTAGTNLATDKNVDFFCGLKCGFYNLINSMMVEFNTKNVIQQTQFLNVFTHFKTMTSWSEDDLKNNGFTYHVYPDRSDSWSYNLAANVDGMGISNNKNVPVTIDELNDAGKVFNEGFKKRQEWLAYDPLKNTGQGSIITTSNANQLYKNVIETSAGKRVYYIVAKISLKMMSDFFDKIPLLKGSKMSITINTNQVQTTFSVNSSGIITINNNNVQGYVNPLLLSSALKDNGGEKLKPATGSATYYVSLSIQRNNFQVPSDYAQTGDATPLTSCRLYVPGYKFNAIAEQQYLELAPVKKIIYRDIFQFTSPEVSSQFSINVTNGISNLRSVLVCPYLSRGANGNGDESDQLNSPFSTLDPVIPITNFNIQVAGINLFNNNELYDFEQFTQELGHSNQLNGNITTGLTSGLISEYDFTSGKRYYYGDCSRIEPGQDGVARAVQIIGKIEAADTIRPKLICFCEFERELTVDVRTGQIVQ